MYLWLPRVWKWAAFKAHLLFNAKATTAKARDFNWHHVFGIWSAIPLAVVVATATVFSYPWANDLVYRAVGEQPPRSGGGGGGGARRAASRSGRDRPERHRDRPVGLRRATRARGRARRMAHADAEPSVRSATRRPCGSASTKATAASRTCATPSRSTRSTGAVESYAPFSSQTTGQKARSWIRFLHTGEALGIVGQTIAGLVSFTSILMVWTGLALAYRRLLQPLLRRKRATTTPGAA